MPPPYSTCSSNRSSNSGSRSNNSSLEEITGSNCPLLQRLNDVMLLSILLLLPPLELAAAIPRVCRRLRRVSACGYLWQQVLRRAPVQGVSNSSNNRSVSRHTFVAQCKEEIERKKLQTQQQHQHQLLVLYQQQRLGTPKKRRLDVSTSSGTAFHEALLQFVELQAALQQQPQREQFIQLVNQ